MTLMKNFLNNLYLLEDIFIVLINLLFLMKISGGNFDDTDEFLVDEKFIFMNFWFVIHKSDFLE